MIHDRSNRAPRNDGRPSTFGSRVGEPFNPWRRVNSFYPPDIVSGRRDLTDGQKRLYERAVRWAGQKGIFWRGFESMAEALGKSVRQVKTDMAALEAKGLIRHVRRRRNSNVYQFLWHPMFEAQSAAPQQVGLEVQDSALEVQDDVILEVQPTARESSQLESCPLNFEKADQKRIPGYASQEPRSAASLSSTRTEDDRNQAPKADSPESVAREPGPPGQNPVRGWTQEQLDQVRRRIVAFWGREPEEGFEVSMMLRARDASAAAVCELLDRKYANRNCRVGGRFAPRNQNWFLTVVENEFVPGHLPETPAPPERESDVEPELLNRGTETIELPDAPRSIVESALCSRCGGQALVRYTDGTIEGCGCRNKEGEGLGRMPATSAVGKFSSGKGRSASE